MTKHPAVDTRTRGGSGPTEQIHWQIDWQSELARHAGMLRSVVLGRLGSAQGVEEVLQEVALAAVRQQAPLADRSRIGAWLYRLAVTQSLLYRRRLGRRRRLHRNYAEHAAPTDGDRQHDPLHWLLSEERRALVRQALGALPVREAEILLLKHAENLSYHELADLLQISHSAVESRLHRARLRLRAELAALQVTEVSG